MSTPRPLRVLFVCVENSNRSQMAEAFARLRGGARVEAWSAGSRPAGRVNPKAIASMRELGYDLTTHLSKGLLELPDIPFDAAVTMGCGDACPNVRARVREDWQIPDPREMGPDEFLLVRERIEQEVVALLARLGVDTAQRLCSATRSSRSLLTPRTQRIAGERSWKS